MEPTFQETTIDVKHDNMFDSIEGAEAELNKRTEEEKKKEQEEIDGLMQSNIDKYNNAFNQTILEVMTGGEVNGE